MDKHLHPDVLPEVGTITAIRKKRKAALEAIERTVDFAEVAGFNNATADALFKSQCAKYHQLGIQLYRAEQQAGMHHLIKTIGEEHIVPRFNGNQINTY